MLFEDRASQHKSPSSLALAEELGIEVRLLPQGDPGIERDGSPVEARQEAGGWGPTDRHRRQTPLWPSANTSST